MPITAVSVCVMKDTLLNNIDNDDIHLASFLSHVVSNSHNDSAYSHTLTVIGQAVTPYLLHSVLIKLNDVFTPSSAAFHHLHKQMGDDVIEIRGALQNTELEQIKPLLGDVSKAYNVDVGLQGSRPSLSEPGLLVMDMDSTVIAIECIDEIAKLAGVGEQVAEVTAKAMRGEIAFNDSFFADHLKARLGLDFAISNTLAVKNEQLTGKVEGEIVNADVKARTVNALAEKATG